MKKILFFLCSIVFALSLTGCHSSKKTADGGLDSKQLGEAKVRFETVVDNGFSYDCLQAKAKYSLKGKTLSGKFFLEHGKRMCMTVTMLGIELARVEANTEVVYIVDKFDRIYAKVPIAEFASKLGLQDEASFDAIEALFLGRIFVPGHGVAQNRDFKRLAWKSLENDVLQGSYSTQKYGLTYDVDANNNLSKTQVVLPGGGSAFTWKYGSPVKVADGFLPSEQTLIAKTADIDLSAQISLSSVDLKKSWTSFSPSGYREVSFAELLQTIKKVAG